MITSNPATPTAAAYNGAPSGASNPAEPMAAAAPSAPAPITAEQCQQLAHNDMLFGAQGE
jgi:hypothetical protein